MTRLKKSCLLCSAVLAPLFLAGCVTPQDMEAMRSDINRLQIQVAGLQDNLNKTNQELQSSVVQGNQQLRAQNREIQSKVEEIASASDVVKKNQADINAKMDTLTSGVQAIGGKGEEGQASAMSIGSKLDSMNATLNQRMDSIDRSIGAVEKSVIALEKNYADLPKAEAGGKSGASNDVTASAQKEPDGGTTDGKPATPPVPVGDPKEIYETAYRDYSKGNFDLAIAGFEGFLKDFPDAALSANAQYWLGECYYSKRDFDRAISEFDKVIKDYPGAIKVPSAYLKKGFALDEKGSKEAAKAQYRKIVEAFPLAPEAATARERLKARK